MVKMNPETREKLRRYLVNADPFLWNVLEKKNKKARIQELLDLGFLAGYLVGTNATYNKINQDLLVEIGIEGIITNIVVPRVTKLFKPDTLQYFRRCWEQGQTPAMEYLKKNRLYNRHMFSADSETHDDWTKALPVVGYKEPAFVFVQIDTQAVFVERWTVFAGLWFEEIEPLIH